LNQTFPHFELIICDDASEDNTEQVVRSFKDDRIRYYRNEKNLGLYRNWNRCIDLASGEYIAIYHDHDLYLPTIVERSVALLEKYPTASFSHTALLLIDDVETIVGVDIRPFSELTPGKQMVRLLACRWASPIMAATAIVRREAYKLVGPYRAEEYGLCADMDMWFRLSQIGDAAYVNEPQALVRVRTKGQSTAQFRWNDVLGSLRMRRDHIKQAFKGDYLAHFINTFRYVFERDACLATFMVRAILLESPEVVSEGEMVIRTQGSLWVNLLTQMVKRSGSLQSILREFALPIHYKKTQRQLEMMQEQANKYLADNPLAKEILHIIK
jgi:glycosyltransferase involved in cell wall biosynthesis